MIGPPWGDARRRRPSHLPPDDDQRPADVEPDTLIARRQIEDVRSMFLAGARLLYRDARLKDLMAQRRELRGDIQDAEQAVRRKRTELAEVGREIASLRPPGNLGEGLRRGASPRGNLADIRARLRRPPLRP